jgi:cell wall-associated NlpC family hydrolase
MSKGSTGLLAAVGVVLAVVCGGIVVLPVLVAGQAAIASACTGGGAPEVDVVPGKAFGNWDASQVTNATTIVAVGVQMKVPPRGYVIAVATAMQESSLVNLGDLGKANDHDSLGLFQQRPSQGWGTPAQVMNPVYAAGKFYGALLKIGGWQQMRLTDAAQAVQRSGFPDAYQKWERDAIALVAHVVPTIPPDQLKNLGGDQLAPGSGGPEGGICTADGGDGLVGSNGTTTIPAGFTLPEGTPPTVAVAIGWALAQLGTSYTFGGDCTAAHSSDPSHHCDCSSLVMMAYHAAGIHLPRVAADQSHEGTPVYDHNQIRPGDLLFIPGSDGTASRPGHVGMYIGQGLLVQAPHTGDVVKISKLSSWLSELSSVRRIVNA